MLRRTLAIAAFATLTVIAVVAIGAKPAVGALSVRSVPVGSRPAWVAVDAGAGRAYVTNSGSGTLSVVDLAAGTTLAVIPVGRGPGIVALDTGIARGYVSNYDDSSVTVVDLTANTVVATVGAGGLGLAVDPIAHTVYAAAGKDIAVLDGATGVLRGRLVAPAGAAMWGVAVDAQAGRLFVTDILRPRVLVMDPRSGSLVGTVGISAPARFGIAYDASTSRLYVAGYVSENAELAVVDGRRLQVLARAPVGPLPFSITLSAARGLAFVGSLTSGTISAIDAATGTPISTLPAGRSSLGLAEHGGDLLAVDPVDDEILGQRGRLLIIALATVPSGTGR